MLSPVGEIGKHALAHLYVPTITKYANSMVCELNAYITYKVLKLLITSCIILKVVKIANITFS